MSDADKGQVSGSAAEVYEAFFVPSLFAEWAPRVAELGALGQGNHVLDVGCGTGVVARHAQSLVGDRGRVVAIDPNEGMLAVAKRTCDGVEFHAGAAESLPFEDDTFDATLSQFAMMFFEDRVAATREMARVTRAGGRIVVGVWDALERSPGYHAMTQLLRDLFGDDVARAMYAPFCMGSTELLRDVFADADLDAGITTIAGRAKFSSIDAWVQTDIKGWTLADMLDDEQFERLRVAANSELAEFVTAAGTVEFASPAHLAVATTR